MIVGLGVDIVELERIARTFRRFGGKFAERILAPTGNFPPRSFRAHSVRAGKVRRFGQTKAKFHSFRI